MNYIAQLAEEIGLRTDPDTLDWVARVMGVSERVTFRAWLRRFVRDKGVLGKFARTYEDVPLPESAQGLADFFADDEDTMRTAVLAWREYKGGAYL
jgi:hypothetical protein